MFLSYLFIPAPFAQALKELDRGRPSAHSRQGLGSICAVCLTWRALKVFFRREWTRRFPGFSVRALIHFHTYKYVRFFLFFARSTAQTTHNSKQRACLPPADCETKTLLPSSSTRQHHVRVAGPRCDMASRFIGACDRSYDVYVSCFFSQMLGAFS